MDKVNMRSSRTRLLSLILCISMFCSVLAPAVMAGDEEPIAPENAEEVFYGEAAPLPAPVEEKTEEAAPVKSAADLLYERLLAIVNAKNANELFNALQALSEEERALLGEERLKALEQYLYALRLAENSAIFPEPQLVEDEDASDGIENEEIKEELNEGDPAENENDPDGIENEENEEELNEDDPGEEEISPADRGAALFNELTAIEDKKELLAAIDALGSEFDLLTNEQLDCLLERLGLLPDPAAPNIESEGRSVTDVAPFLPPVMDPKPVKKMVLKSAAKAAAAPSNAPKPDNGVVLNKTIRKGDTDDSYVIRLEAYATGEKVVRTVTTDKPTDIILVLDQSKSMENDIGTVSYNKVSSYKNSTLYTNRSNLFYKLSDGKYARVTVERSERSNPSYSQLSKKNSTYYNSRNNLYYLFNGNYLPVTVTKSTSGFGLFSSTTYSYTCPGGWTGTKSSDGDNTDPKLNLYTRTDTPVYTYTYSYVDADGVKQTLGSSVGADTNLSGVTLYGKSVSTSGGGSRLAALKSAVSGFANAVADKAKGADGTLGTEDDVNHRIAVIGFASTDYKYDNNFYEYRNTELFIGSKQYNFANATVDNDGTKHSSGSYPLAGANNGQYYKSAFQDMSTAAGQTNVNASIAALEAYGATFPNHGMTMANNVFANNPTDGEERNRVVIVFTDGVPGENSYEKNTAAAAINLASVSKNTYGATVYAIGLVSGADATQAGSETGSDADKCNYFLQRLSSNNGTVRAPSYYLSATDADDLSTIFQQIANQIEDASVSTTLDEEAVVRDVVTPYFTIPEGSELTVKVEDCIGESNGALTFGDPYDLSGLTASFDTNEVGEEKTLNVSGFDFAENWCGTTTTDGSTSYHGKRLVVEFTITPEEGFLGGNNVETNVTGKSGIFENDKEKDAVESFPDPDNVNVEIKPLTLTTSDKNVYLNDSLTVDQLVAQSTIKCGDIVLFDEDGNPVTEEWQQAYVKITPNSGVTNTALTEDTKYTLTAVVTPAYPTYTSDVSEKAFEAVTIKDEAWIYVFKPVLTFKDTSAVRDQVSAATVDYTAMDYVSTVWKHGSTADSAVTLTGAAYEKSGKAPELTLTYTPDPAALLNGKFHEDTPVTVTVKEGASNVTSYTTFVHANCDVVDNCGFDASEGQFMVHLLDTVLTPDANFIRVGKVFKGIKDESLIPADFAIKIVPKSGGLSYVMSGSNPDMEKTTDEEGNIEWVLKITGVDEGGYTISEVNADIDDYNLEASGTGDVTVKAATFKVDTKEETTNSHLNWDVYVDGDTSVMFACSVTGKLGNGCVVISLEALSASQRANITNALVVALGGPFKEPVRFYSIEENGYGPYSILGKNLRYDPEAKEVIFEDTSMWQHVARITVSVKAADNPDINVTNTYTPKTGKLKITKTVTAADGDTLAKTLDALKENGFVLSYKDPEGETVTDPNPVEWKIADDKKAAVYTWDVGDVAPGDYTATEANADVSGIAPLELTYSGDHVGTVTANETTELALTNAYAYTNGTLTITKTITAENAKRLEYVTGELEDTLTFTYKLSGEQTGVTLTLEDFFFSNGVYTYVTSVPMGDYTVEETGYSVTGFDRTASDTSVSVTVAPQKNATAAFTNDYRIKTGTIQVTKTLVDGDGNALTGSDLPWKSMNYIFQLSGTTISGESVTYYVPVEIAAGANYGIGSVNYAIYGTYTCTELTSAVGSKVSLTPGSGTLDDSTDPLTFAACNTFDNHVDFDTEVANNKFTYSADSKSWSWERVL